MELDEMKNLWGDMSQESHVQKGLTSDNISDVTLLKYNKQAKIFKVGEIMGLYLAYTLAGLILLEFDLLNNWYLRMSGITLTIYLLVMPLYTMSGIIRMAKIDLVNSTYKEVLEHFYAVKSRLKQAEKISLMASPFLFVAALLIMTKIFVGINLFDFDIQLPVIFFMGVAFLAAVLFNVWTFNKRDQQLKSVKQLLEEDNQS